MQGGHNKVCPLPKNSFDCASQAVHLLATVQGLLLLNILIEWAARALL